MDCLLLIANYGVQISVPTCELGRNCTPNPQWIPGQTALQHGSYLPIQAILLCENRPALIALSACGTLELRAISVLKLVMSNIIRGLGWSGTALLKPDSYLQLDANLQASPIRKCDEIWVRRPLFALLAPFFITPDPSKTSCVHL